MSIRWKPSLRPRHHASAHTPDPSARLPHPLPIAPTIRTASGRGPHFRNANGAAAAPTLRASGRLGSSGLGGPVLHVVGGVGVGGAVAGVCGRRRRRVADGSLLLGRQRRARGCAPRHDAQLPFLLALGPGLALSVGLH